MTFNLTPVVQQSTPMQYPAAASQMELNFTRDLDSGGVDSQHVIGFSPPLNISSTGSLTPDFTGLLPPPPPQGLRTGASSLKASPQSGQERLSSHTAATSKFSPTSIASTVFSPPLAAGPPTFLEPYFGKTPTQPLNLSPPPSSQLSLLL